jgi:hypothetical protein
MILENIPVVADSIPFLKYFESPLSSLPNIVILTNSKIEVIIPIKKNQSKPAPAPHPRIPALIPPKS